MSPEREATAAVKLHPGGNEPLPVSVQIRPRFGAGTGLRQFPPKPSRWRAKFHRFHFTARVKPLRNGHSSQNEPPIAVTGGQHKAHAESDAPAVGRQEIHGIPVSHQKVKRVVQ